MNPLELTAGQLKRAAAIKEQIEALNKELAGILGAAAKSTPALRAKGKRTMSAAVRKKIAASQRARWTKLRSADKGAAVKAAAKAK